MIKCNSANIENLKAAKCSKHVNVKPIKMVLTETELHDGVMCGNIIIPIGGNRKIGQKWWEGRIGRYFEQ